MRSFNRLSIAVVVGTCLAQTPWALASGTALLLARGETEDEPIIQAPVADAVQQKEQKVRWRVSSPWSENVPMLGEAWLRVRRNLRERSNSRFLISLKKADSIVESKSVPRGMERGEFEAAWTSAEYFAEQVPALDFVSSVPFVPADGAMYRWVTSPRGRIWNDRLHAQLGMKAIPCSTLGPDGGGWFMKPVTKSGDLLGLRVRSFGLPARVLDKAGATTSEILGRDLRTALSDHTIDAAEFSAPHMDIYFRLYDVARHYYYPGWSGGDSIISFMVGLRAWERLSTANRELLEEVCAENIQWALGENARRRADALATLRDIHGVNIKPFEPEVAAALRRAWEEVVEELAESSAQARAISDDYRAFLRANGLEWRRL